MAVYGYARVSTTEQSEEGNSLDTQRRMIEGRAKEVGAASLRIFTERGVSGATPLEDRPQGKLLVAAVKPGDVVIASKLDRMFRSANDALRVLEDFKKRKISLILIDMGGDVTGNGIAQLVFTILSAVAQFERERIQDRIRDVKADQKQNGKYLGGTRPFGYRVSADGRLEEDPAEQKAVKLIVRMKGDGKSLRVIAEAVKKRTGYAVSHMAVKRVIEDQRDKAA